MNEQPELSADEMEVLRHMFEHGVCSIETVAADLGFSEAWVESCLESLAQKGLISAGGPCRVYRAFMRGGLLDGLELEMVISEEKQDCLFTLPAKQAVEHSLILADHEIPSTVQDGKVIVLVGVCDNAVFGRILRYRMSTDEAKSTAGIDMYYDGLLAAGTVDQMQTVMKMILLKLRGR